MGGTDGLARAWQDFRDDVTQMAWDIVDDVLRIEISRRRLGIVEVSAPRSHKKEAPKKGTPTKSVLFAGMLDSKDGFWTRDSKHYYCVESRGTEAGTWVFRERNGEKKITVKWKTLLSKWKVMVKI